MGHTIYYGDELLHYGLLGMKWGIRRFQNPDGTLTAEGRIRYREDGTKRSRSEQKTLRKAYENSKKSKAKAEADKILKEQKSQKKISEMTDEELQKYISRKTSEKNAYQLNQDIARLNPKQLSTGEKLVKDLMEKTIMPAVTNVGKQYLEKVLKDAAKLNDKPKETEEQRLKRESAEWTNKANIEKQKNIYNEELRKSREASGKEYIEVKKEELGKINDPQGSKWFINADDDKKKKG